jgi:hypothetical protein
MPGAARELDLPQASKLPLETMLDNFDLKRLPQKAARQVKTFVDGTFLDRQENILASAILAAAKRTYYRRSARS